MQLNSPEKTFFAHLKVHEILHILLADQRLIAIVLDRFLARKVTHDSYLMTSFGQSLHYRMEELEMGFAGKWKKPEDPMTVCGATKQQQNCHKPRGFHDLSADKSTNGSRIKLAFSCFTPTFRSSFVWKIQNVEIKGQTSFD